MVIAWVQAERLSKIRDCCYEVGFDGWVFAADSLSERRNDLGDIVKVFGVHWRHLSVDLRVVARCPWFLSSKEASYWYWWSSVRLWRCVGWHDLAMLCVP